jgi:hypothetical protein
MGYVTKIKVAGKTLRLGYFSHKSEADIPGWIHGQNALLS